MLKRFRFLRCIGSPTQWDVGDYLRYRDRIASRIPEDLASMISDERFELGSAGTFWHAELVRSEMVDGFLALDFRSASGERRFRFEYTGTMRIQSDLSDLRFMPVMIVQELIRTKWGFRHSIGILGGGSVVVTTQAMRFIESLVH